MECYELFLVSETKFSSAMFPTSTQAQHWMFKSETELNVQRSKTNQLFIDRWSVHRVTILILTFICSHQSSVPSGASEEYFLTEQEEVDVVFYFSVKLREFCDKFKPPMPNYVKGTSFHYFKRFYLNNSVMNYHPKEILVTAVYLACKVEEFNVSMQQFVANVQGNQERATRIILNNELLLMQELQFHLTIHNPFRYMLDLWYFVWSFTDVSIIWEPVPNRFWWELYFKGFCQAQPLLSFS